MDYPNSPKYPELNESLKKIAAKYGVSTSTIAMAWILRHPAHMMPITGTRSASHLADNAKAAEIELIREEWYELWKATGNFIR